MPAIPPTPKYGDDEESNMGTAAVLCPPMKRQDSRDDWVTKKPVDSLSASKKQGDDAGFPSSIDEKRNILKMHSRRGSLPSLHIQKLTDSASDLLSGFSISDRKVCGAGCLTAPVHKSEVGTLSCLPRFFPLPLSLILCPVLATFGTDSALLFVSLQQANNSIATSSDFDSVPLKAWPNLPRDSAPTDGTPIAKPSSISKSHHARLSESVQGSSAGSTPKSGSSRKNVMIKDATGGRRRASRRSSNDSNMSDSSSSLSSMVSAVINVSTKFVMKNFSGSRRSSIPVVEPFSRSKAWKLSKSTVWKSSFALVKDEAHATRWDEIMNMVRSGLTADPEIIEQVNLQFAERFRPAFCGFSFFFLSIFTLQVLYSATRHSPQTGLLQHGLCSFAENRLSTCRERSSASRHTMSMHS